jgi:hypothetical protein
MLALSLRRYAAPVLFTVFAAVTGCASGDPESTASGSSHLERGSIDPDYVGEWVPAPGETATFTSLSLQSDGHYTLTRSGKSESGTWDVVFHDDWDWIWVHELTLSSDSGTSFTYGAEVSVAPGLASFYPDGSTHDAFTALTKKAAASIPATCDFATQGCGGGTLDGVLACIPANSSATTGTCTGRARGCATPSGCEDPADMCIVPNGHFGSGYCVPRAADVPSCDVAAQDCADPALVCMPHDASQTRGYCQRAYTRCSATDDFQCRIGNSVCLTTPSRSFCVRQH